MCVDSHSFRTFANEMFYLLLTEKNQIILLFLLNVCVDSHSLEHLLMKCSICYLQKKPDWSKKGDEKKVGEKEVEA